MLFLTLENIKLSIFLYLCKEKSSEMNRILNSVFLALALLLLPFSCYKPNYYDPYREEFYSENIRIRSLSYSGIPIATYPQRGSWEDPFILYTFGEPNLSFFKITPENPYADVVNMGKHSYRTYSFTIRSETGFSRRTYYIKWYPY